MAQEFTDVDLFVMHNWLAAWSWREWNEVLG
jgi:hypothetical protein